jgi:glycosyltransferase involved in cell wall biosynthesis
MPTATPLVSVIVPVHDGAATLPMSLAAVRASELPADQLELIVVDDASSDETAEVAARYADRVIRLAAPPHGPAHARNRGSEIARAEVLVFVDADVCVHPDALDRLRAAFEAEPDVVAAFGCYDTHPPAPGLVSQYRNLVHHYVHWRHAGDADTFWAGLGAVRRGEFLAVGGFDERRYPRPQIEDIELGYRLRALGGRIVLDPAVRGTHLKRWTLRQVVRSDVLDRGVPWMRLLLERRSVGAGTLNIRLGERAFTVLTVAGTALILSGALARSTPLLAVGLACLLLVLAGNAHLLRWFAQVRGPGFAAAVVPLRLLYYLLNGLSVALALLHRPRPLREPSTP